MSSRKDYVAAAKITATHFEAGKNDATLHAIAVGIQEAFVSFFRQTGERFDADRFRAACKNVRRPGKE